MGEVFSTSESGLWLPNRENLRSMAGTAGTSESMSGLALLNQLGRLLLLLEVRRLEMLKARVLEGEPSEQLRVSLAIWVETEGLRL